MSSIYRVSIPHTHRDYFDYHAEEHVDPCVGARVWVPFRNQQRVGLVVGKMAAKPNQAKTKAISQVIDEEALLSTELLSLCFWVSQYYQSPLSEVIPLVLPKKYRSGEHHKPLMCDYYQLKKDQAEALCEVSKAPRQYELLALFSTRETVLSKKQILQAGFTGLQLKSLLARDILGMTCQVEKPISTRLGQTEHLSLNDEQRLAVDTVSAHLNAFRCFLLQGVTGSGKTEVYLQVIAKVLAAGRQVLVLVPEIGLTPQLLERFYARLHEPMAVLHSNLNDSERQRAWLWAKETDVKLIIGTRTAIFTPMPDLGLIIIDEEHDPSLKQLDGVRYSARDTALMRAHARNIPIILGSATPSLESFYNCLLHKYTRLVLTQKAMNSAPLHYQVLDIRDQILQHGLAPHTLNMIKETLDQKNQVLVFINRRGFAPVLLCHQCGWMADCRACDSHLTMHRRLGRLICHHCGLTQVLPTSCQQCKSRELLPVGVGTQRVYEFLSQQFPHVSMARVDRDEVRKKHAFNECLAQISSGDIQLIVGTQMLAKGHHFPRLTLVVVVDADNGFYNQDFRALERLGQLLTQVAGRAGRAELPGKVVIQTHLPQHPLLNLLIQEGYEAFAQALLAKRKEAQLPPYQYLTLIRAQAKMPSTVLHFLHAVKSQLRLNEIQVLGPAPAPLERKAGQYRMQLLVKSSSRKKLNVALTLVREWLLNNKICNGVRWGMDTDPIDLS